MSDTNHYEVTVSVRVVDVDDVKEAIECVEESWDTPDWVEATYPRFEQVKRYD